MTGDAPVAGAAETVIDAPAETVWEVLTAIADWPSWNPDVKAASIDGAVEPGTVFRWKAGPGTIASTLQEVDRPRLVSWTGRTFGLNAFHVWRLEQRDGGTLVQTEESFDGTSRDCSGGVCSARSRPRSPTAFAT